MRTAEEIHELYLQRRNTWLVAHGQMQHISDIVSGRIKINLPEMDRWENASVPNLIGQGIDGLAARIASTLPDQIVTPRSDTRREVRRAETVTNVLSAWARADDLRTKLMYRARHLVGYGMSPVVLRWDARRGLPTREVQTPLGCYPAPDLIPGTVTPVDVIFVYKRSLGWLRAKGFGHVVDAAFDRDVPDTAMATLLEYHGPGQATTVLATNGEYEGDLLPPEFHQTYAGASRKSIVLAHSETCDEPCAVVPTRVGLDNVAGQFNNLIGTFLTQAKLMALELIAVEKGIFPDTVLESFNGQVGRIVGDTWKDGRTGEINVVVGGQVREIQSAPAYQAQAAIDRLERSQRVTGGIPADLGGESATNIRTARRGDAVLQAAIDHPIAEAQTVLAQSLRAEARIAMKLARRKDGLEPRTFIFGEGRTARQVTYNREVFNDEDDPSVTYPIVGTDANTLLVAIGQRVGMGTMSKATAARLDPYVQDPEFEHDTIIAEGLEAALVASLQAKTQSGELPPRTVARIMKLVSSNRMELAEAVDKAIEEAQQEAQEKAAAAAEGAMPDPATLGAEAAQAGLAGEISPIPGASEGQEEFASLMGKLRLPLMAVSNRVGGTDASGAALV